MSFPVLKGASYALIQANDMVIHQGSTQTSERHINPDSEHLKNISSHLRSFEDAVKYPPNQVYIGNLRPRDLNNIQRPWYENSIKDATRNGKYGEIMPLDEFYGLMKAVDAFDLVILEESFQKAVYEKLSVHPAVKDWKFLEKLMKNYGEIKEIEDLVSSHKAEPMYFEDKLIGCVKKAHDFDAALSEHVMFENLVSKASACFSLALLLYKTDLNPEDVEYVIECSEEACGDMNQRGGGNFAKSIGEACGLVNATGSDTRSFCAGPAHAMVEAAALVKSGVYKNVVVVAGGASAKLGLNAKDHVKKGLRVLEDMLGGFAILVGEDDGVSPIIRTDVVGRHTIGSGSSPQAVMQAIVANPLDNAGIRLAEIDTFSVEMQNPEITEPAGAGDVPKANYKMIAALGVMRKDFEKSQLNEVVDRISMPGFAPTQGHIPSGVPFLAHCIEMIADGSLNKAMVVGKGSLFLGRLTNLFDGVSFLVEKNPGFQEEVKVTATSVNKKRIGLTLFGSEHGVENLVKGAELAARQGSDYDVVLIGPKVSTDLELVEATDDKDAYAKMEQMLDSGKLDGCVTMHYSFPIGVSTVGKVITPGQGKEMFLATTTGTSSTNRVEAMVKNAIYGIIAAKSTGIKNPTLGILNVDGAVQVERALKELKENGYPIEFSESVRSDGGAIMRGNDLLGGSVDVMITDTLTGNIMMKVFSAYTTGGSYESLGYGYGPGIGENYKRLVLILSRASGVPVVANAIRYGAQLAQGGILKVANEEFGKLRKAGFDKVLSGIVAKSQAAPSTEEEVKAPEKEVVTEEITGVDILELEEAVTALWKEGIYAESGMGCTGPVVMVNDSKAEKAIEALVKAGYLTR